MPLKTCTRCQRAFHQAAGRPTTRCPACRSAKYGPVHKALRAAGLETAYGQPCCRCGELMTYPQPLDLDHDDDGNGYRGFAHQSCNRSAGARKRNGQVVSSVVCRFHNPPEKSCPHSEAW